MPDNGFIAENEPYPVEVEAGKTYFWCTCGRSAKQPLCDGGHDGTDKRPLPFKAESAETKYFCGCKQTKTPPFCDGAHKAL
jgi:CDGSH iron-sulfur domain-containing protein 3